MSERTFKRVALVTGATSGIGEATARRFVKAGFGVVGTGRRSTNLQALEQELGGDFVGIAGDIAESGMVASLFDTCQERLGRMPDIVVANAGRGLGGSVTQADFTQFKGILDLNVSGVMELVQHAAKFMLPRQEILYPENAADIVVIGSVVGYHISPFSAVYGATKFAVHALTEGLRRELGPKGVRVTLVAPGITISGFQEAASYSAEMLSNFDEKFGPLLVSDDVAQAILHTVTLPPRVHISNLVVRPTRQDYP